MAAAVDRCITITYLHTYILHSTEQYERSTTWPRLAQSPRVLTRGWSGSHGVPRQHGAFNWTLVHG